MFCIVQDTINGGGRRAITYYKVVSYVYILMVRCNCDLLSLQVTVGKHLIPELKRQIALSPERLLKYSMLDLVVSGLQGVFESVGVGGQVLEDTFFGMKLTEFLRYTRVNRIERPR